MKNLLPLTACLFLGMAAPLFAQTAAPGAPAPAAVPKSAREKLGYALGTQIGQTLKKQPIDFDPQFFVAGISDSLTGGTPALSPAQMDEVLAAFNREMTAKQQTTVAAKNKRAAETFLAANKSKPGIQAFPDGMQYKIIKEGTGPMPTEADSVTVKYSGSLMSGAVFDSSDKQPGGAVTFPVGGVIAGWTEALQKMKTGSKWQLFIPSALAYGDQGVSGGIEPGAMLIFDVELVAIAKK